MRLNKNKLVSLEVKMIEFVIVVNRQAKVRLSKWYETYSAKERRRLEREVQNKVIFTAQTNKKRCNILELGEKLLVFRRYASLYFVFCIDARHNPLLCLEQIHFYVQTLDYYFHNVCELDLVFKFDKAYQILDEIFMSGEQQESKGNMIVQIITQEDRICEEENDAFSWSNIGSKLGLW